MAELPSWLNRDYNPAETFLKAYQIGSNIAQSKSALAESQRRTNIEAELQRESLQASMLKAQQELAVQQSYNNARIGIEQAQLTEAERRNQQTAENAAKQLAISQAAQDEAARHNKVDEDLSGRRAATDWLQGQASVLNAAANVERAGTTKQTPSIVTVKYTDDTGVERTVRGSLDDPTIKALYEKAQTQEKKSSNIGEWFSNTFGSSKKNNLKVLSITQE